jgi:hypothetical protein
MMMYMIGMVGAIEAASNYPNELTAVTAGMTYIHVIL